MFYFRHIPQIIQNLYPQRIWRIPSTQKVIYLTFDDGPHPSITPQILELLKKFRAKVTFFQLGSKIVRYPYLHEYCKDEGHTIANHGYYHLDALSIPLSDFIKNINEGAETTNSNLFRPAYGRLPLIGKNQIFSNFQIIMWDIMPGDFDDSLTIDNCIKYINQNVTNGSIIVLHENQKAETKVINILEWILKKYSSDGYSFRAIPPVRHRKTTSPITNTIK